MNEKSLYVPPPIPEKRFPIYIERQKYSGKDEIFRPHWHEHLELIFMVQGELNLTCNTNIYRAKEGDLLIINPNDVHHLQSVTSYVEYYCVVFNLSIVRSIVSDPTDTDFLIPLSNNQLVFEHQSKINKDLNSCLLNLNREYENNHSTRSLAIKAYIFQMLTLLFRNYNHSILTPSTFKRRNCNLILIQNILIHLNEHYSEEINLKNLSNDFNISYHHLCHVFKDYTNKSIIQYLTTVRIDKSLNYLEHSNKSITEIALLIGYNDVNYFSRKFKQLMSVSPREYVRTLNN